jgi:hypothetical protein
MRILTLLILGVWQIIFFVSGANAQLPDRDYFRVSPDSRKYAVIFGGAGADETYRTRFRQWTLKLSEILARDYGYPPDHITLLLGNGDPKVPEIYGPCRRDTILAAMDRLQKQVQPGDQLGFFFIGHGTSDDQDAKFVVAGPDITGADFAARLDGFSNQDLIVVNNTGSGYPFCSSLAAAGRVIVCATRSAAERYDTVFPRFFLEGLENHTADRDKNRRVSMLEAFKYAGQQVNAWYADQDRLPSEHAAIDDNGDGRFDADPDPAEEEGRLAEIAYLDTITASVAETAVGGPAPEALRRLYAEAQELERSVVLLRNRKSKMDEQNYWQQMEPLLIDLARTSRQLRSLEAALQGTEDR